MAKNKNDQKIYAYMARRPDKDKCPSRYFGDSLQLNNWILDSGATCHMAPLVSDFIPSSLEDTDKHIEVANRHHVTAKKGEVRIQIFVNNGDSFIATWYNVLLAPYLYDNPH